MFETLLRTTWLACCLDYLFCFDLFFPLKGDKLVVPNSHILLWVRRSSARKQNAKMNLENLKHHSGDFAPSLSSQLHTDANGEAGMESRRGMPCASAALSTVGGGCNPRKPQIHRDATRLHKQQLHTTNKQFGSISFVFIASGRIKYKNN